MQEQDIVILIDCWEDPANAIRQEMFHNIVTSIPSINPKLVVLATFESNELFDLNLQHSNKWVSTFFSYFPTFQDRYFSNFTYTTSKTILEAEFDCLQIVATRYYQFHFVCEQNNIVPDRIWFFGMHWHSCLRNRELGWQNLRNACLTFYNKEIDIMFKDNCCLKSNPQEIEEFLMIEYDNLIDAKKVAEHTFKMIGPTETMFGKVT